MAVVLGASDGGSASPSASPVGESVDAEPLIRQAAAFRLKYRMAQSIRIPISQVGFHPMNRNGQGVSGQHCEQLLSDVLGYGFDSEEANAGGIVVAAAPSDKTIENYNLAACAGDAQLAPVVMGSIMYGSLSHSHLHQVLKNVAAGVHVDIPEISSGSGALSTELLRQKDAAFADAVVNGLVWEVLSHKMDQEEPKAAGIIQAAMNAKNSVAMLTHEMQCIAAICMMAPSMPAAS